MSGLKKAMVFALTAALAAGAAYGGEPGGTPDALFFSEAALAATVGVSFFIAGYAVGGDPEANAGTTREKASYAIYAAAPLASALATYGAGETVGMRSANRPALVLATAVVSIGVTGGAGALAYALAKEEKETAAANIAFYTVIPAAFLNAVVYNAVKKPYFAEIPGFSGVEVAPTVNIVKANNGERIMNTYGLIISF